MIHCGRTYGSNKSSADLTSGVLISLFLHSNTAASRWRGLVGRSCCSCYSQMIKHPARSCRLSITGRCYERDNSYKTHLAKRSGLFQAHYMNADWLVEGIRKQKQKAIWQSTLSFLPYGR